MVETGKPQLLEVAEQLINLQFDDYPEDQFHKSSSLHTLGEICKLRGDLNAALDYFKEAIDFEMQYPNVKTQSDLEFSELVVKLNRSEYYKEVKDLLFERVENSLFPKEKYAGYSILAIIADRRGDLKGFEQFKALAEENAAKEISGLRYHKYLGLVKKKDPWFDQQLNRNE